MFRNEKENEGNRAAALCIGYMIGIDTYIREQALPNTAAVRQLGGEVKPSAVSHVTALRAAHSMN